MNEFWLILLGKKQQRRRSKIVNFKTTYGRWLSWHLNWDLKPFLSHKITIVALVRLFGMTTISIDTTDFILLKKEKLVFEVSILESLSYTKIESIKRQSDCSTLHLIFWEFKVWILANYSINLFISFCTIFSNIILGWHHDNLAWKYCLLFLTEKKKPVLDH